MVKTLTDVDSLSPTYKKPFPQLTAYKYYQLNRLIPMKAYTDINLANNTWGDGGTCAILINEPDILFSFNPAMRVVFQLNIVFFDSQLLSFKF